MRVQYIIVDTGQEKNTKNLPVKCQVKTGINVLHTEMSRGGQNPFRSEILNSGQSFRGCESASKIDPPLAAL
jgi:hypothetical protein